MTGLARGRLLERSDAPPTGERVAELARVDNLVIEQILTGELTEPVDYMQEHHEWVVVLAGSAVIEVSDERLDLGAGDWVLLPSGMPHRLVRAAPGTNWLAVCLHAR